MAARGRTKADKVLEYETFLDKRLKPDLANAIAHRDKLWEQLNTYTDLEKNIRLMEENKLNKLRVMVNLGNDIYCQADVPNTSRVFVDVGLGFYPEFTWSEALACITNKKSHLTKLIEEESKRVARVKAQIKLVCEGIREILNLA